jgi:DNA-directed RNA polymerase sigma subunit (sigma70/sigma32)
MRTKSQMSVMSAIWWHQIVDRLSGSLRMMANELNVNKETIRQIVHENLRKSKICAKFVPHRLTDEHK